MQINFQELYTSYRQYYFTHHLLYSSRNSNNAFSFPFTKKNSSIEFNNLGNLEYVSNTFITELSDHTHITTLTLDAVYEEFRIETSYAQDDDSLATLDTVIEDVGFVFPLALVSLVTSPLFNSVHSLILKCNYTDNTKYSFYSIGALIELMECLPKNVERLDISGIDLSRIHSAEIQSLFSKIPLTVRVLSFKLINLQHIKIALESLHPQLEALNLNDCRLFNDVSNEKLLNAIITQIPKQLKILGLRGNMIGNMTQEQVTLFANVTTGLDELDISDNRLDLNWNQMVEMLSLISQKVQRIAISWNNLNTCIDRQGLQFVSHLGAALHYLGISGNFEFDQFIQIMRFLPQNIEEFDITFSELPLPLLSNLLNSLPTTIKICNIVEIPDELTILASCFELLPPHIHTLRLPESIIDKPTSLANLPHNINTLDMSGIFVNHFDIDKISGLIRNIPQHVKKCIMRDNHLAYVGIDELISIFLAFHAEMEFVDISKNGFTALGVTELNRRMETVLLAAPSKIHYCLDSNIHVRNDGRLQKTSIRMPVSFLRPPNINGNPFKLTGNLLFFMSFMRKHSLTTHNCIHILSFLYALDIVHHRSIFKQLENQITPANLLNFVSENWINSVVSSRIDSCSQNTKLDLSRCGLNRLELAKFQEIWNRIPKHITHLSVRGNGLQLSDAFKLALPHLPKHIQSFDMSENGFEQCDPQSLENIFKLIPATVLRIAIYEEIPASPAIQIANRKWPLEKYKRLIGEQRDFLDIATSLLTGYINNQLSFWSYWCSNHRAPAIKIVREILSKKITNADDLMERLEEIPLKNEAGDLGKIISFLFSVKANSKDNSNNTCLPN